MREIKFRAWDSAYRRYLGKPWAYYSSAGVVVEGDEKSGWFAPIKDIIMEQYTGLKDKDGVEIYEGDLLQRDFITRIDEVSFMGGAFVVSNRHCCKHCANKDSFNCTLYEYLAGIQKAKVIGNIHENPELLKGTT